MNREIKFRAWQEDDKYIDYELQFNKAFLEPMKVILDAIGWNVEKVANLELFFG